jgi:transcriptional regulator with XRE-family HTH domain
MAAGGRYSPGLLSRVENGFANPPIFVYDRVSEALETPPESLMGDEDVQRPAAEAELTLLRYLRAIGMEPHDALARLAPDPGRGDEEGSRR